MEKESVRKPKATPVRLINDDGTPNFGTFDTPFRDFNTLNYKSSNPFRRLYNQLRRTRWEAIEVVSDKGAFLTVVYKFGLMDIQLTTFFDKSSKKLYVWNNMDVLLNRCHVAENLFNGNKSSYQTKKASIEINNYYEERKAKVKGFSKNKKSGTIEFSFDLAMLSKPSIVSIPIKNKYPVYTEKDLFKFTGSIKINGEEMTDSNSLAIIDDHRGYYPRHSGYDWLTCFGTKNNQPFGLNISDFRDNSNCDIYNENGYWDINQFCNLPNAKFIEKEGIVNIRDELGLINLEFKSLESHKVAFDIILFKIDYKLNFGLLNGYITAKNGEKIIFNDDLSLSEYRYTVI
jgi:hypothetical protein